MNSFCTKFFAINCEAEINTFPELQYCRLQQLVYPLHVIQGAWVSAWRMSVSRVFLCTEPHSTNSCSLPPLTKKQKKTKGRQIEKYMTRELSSEAKLEEATTSLRMRDQTNAQKLFQNQGFLGFQTPFLSHQKNHSNTNNNQWNNLLQSRPASKTKRCWSISYFCFFVVQRCPFLFFS